VSEQRKRRGLSSRPKVQELRHAEGKDKALAVVGLVLVLGATLAALLWGRSSGALSGPTAAGGALTVPTLDVPGGLISALLGGVVLFLGWRLYRLTVILVGLSIGAGVAGGLGWLVAGNSGAFVGGFLGGLVGAAAAWPAEVMIRTASGAIAGMTLGLLLGSWADSPLAMILCGLGGVLLGGGLTFLFYRALIMAYSSIIGALVVVYGALSVWRPLKTVELRPWVLGAVAALTVVGLCVQRSLDVKEKDKQQED
jgi:hypothetical protein